MSEQNIVAAVDIGTNTVICLIGKQNKDNKIDILGHSIVASSGVRRGVILNINEAALAIKKAVNKASERLAVEVKKLHVNVAGQQLHTIEQELEKQIDEGKIISRIDVQKMSDEARIVDLTDGDKVYHTINQSYTVDGETGISNPIGITGVQLLAEYRLIVGPKVYEDKLRTAIENAGFEMVRCRVNAVAAGEAVLSDDEKEAGVVVVDMGGGTTSISIYQENVLRYLAVIPFGGNVVTNDIKEGYTLLLRQAEALKVQYGKAMGEQAEENKVVTIPGINGWEPKEISFKSLAYIIQARVEEIVESIYFQIDKSGYADCLGAGIVLTGGGARLKGIKQLVQFKSGLDVRVGKAINGLLSDGEKTIDNPQYATAFGLLKLAIKNSNNQYDEVIQKKRQKKEKAKSNIGEALIQKLNFFFNEDDDAELEK